MVVQSASGQSIRHSRKEPIIRERGERGKPKASRAEREKTAGHD